MKRVAVIGCSGAGKSRFSSRLGEIERIPVFHLDPLYWRPAIRDADPSKWSEIQSGLAAQDSWIIDGNYGATLDLRLKRADTLIFFDFSSVACVAGVVTRALRSRLAGQRQEDWVSGCNNRLDFDLLKQSWSFGSRHREGIIKGAARYSDLSLVRFRNRGEADRFLAERLELSRARGTCPAGGG